MADRNLFTVLSPMAWSGRDAYFEAVTICFSVPGRIVSRFPGTRDLNGPDYSSSTRLVPV